MSISEIISIDSITNKYILDIYNEELEYINTSLETIIDDYNVLSNNNIEKLHLICASNKLLLTCILNINIDYIDNHKKAHDFIMLYNTVSFWILYKYLTNDNYITSYNLEYYICFNYKKILNVEIDILTIINYNVYPLL